MLCWSTYSLVCAQVSLATGNWEVLAVAEAATPGDFAVWFVLDHKQLHSVTVRMPRTIYVNMLEPIGLDTLKVMRNCL